MKYSQGNREGPDKGLSPSRDETQVLRDRAEAETTGETSFTTTKDMLSRTDTNDEVVSFQYLQSAAIIDLNTVQKLSEPGYVGPEGLTFTMYSYYEQVMGVKELYETNGTIMQPPSMLTRIEAKNPALARAEKWWLCKWEEVKALPEHPAGGYVEGSRRVDTIFIKTSEQNAHLKEQETKKLLHENKQAQGTPLKPKQKRENEGTKYAPIGRANLLQPFHKDTPTEIAIAEPNELDKQYEAAIDREASKRAKTGTTENTWDNDRARLLVFFAEQTHRLSTVGVTCPTCGNKGTLETREPQQGISIICQTCNSTPLLQCDTMESAGIPTEIEQAQKLVGVKQAATATLGEHLETNSKGGKRTCTTRERQITQIALRRLEVEGLNEQDQEAGISLIGTGNREVLMKTIAMGEKLFYYMQEDIPEIARIQQEKQIIGRQQQETTDQRAEALKALNQQIRERQQQDTAQDEASKIDKLKKK